MARARRSQLAASTAVVEPDEELEEQVAPDGEPEVLEAEAPEAPAETPQVVTISMADFEALQAKLRADILAEVTAKQAERKQYSGPRPGTYEFWTTSPSHNPKLWKGQGEWLRFVDGHIIVDNDTDAARLRKAFPGQIWETDWPEDKAPPRCPVTNYSPRSFEAWRAYERWSKPDDPNAFG